MRNSILYIFLASLLFLFSSAFAQEEMQSRDMKMQHSEHAGKLIRETDIDGYRLTYHLMELQSQMKNMVGMQHDMDPKAGAHHLMVYVKDAQGKTIDSAQTGYLVVGPDGAEQKVMAMGMSGAYGADVNLSKPGQYTIKCKTVIGDKKLLDEFTYIVDDPSSN